MSRQSVNAILNEIESLDPGDRLKLEREMARRLEGEWKTAAGKARKVARGRGITQSTIDRAIERRRYRA